MAPKTRNHPEGENTMPMLPWFSAKILCCFLMQFFQINPVWDNFVKLMKSLLAEAEGGLFRTHEEASGISSLVENTEGVAVLHNRGVLAVEMEHGVLGLACHKQLPLHSASSKKWSHGLPVVRRNRDCEWTSISWGRPLCSDHSGTRVQEGPHAWGRETRLSGWKQMQCTDQLRA